MNGDSVVDIADLLALLEAWGTNNPAADLDGNGIVNIADLLVVLGGWGQPCTTGSCCLDDYCIDEVTSDDCYEMGGSYRGDETVCKDEYECVTIGSCCFTPYECEELVTEAECDAWVAPSVAMTAPVSSPTAGSNQLEAAVTIHIAASQA